MSYRNNSPRWIAARFSGKCRCGAAINKGDNVLYYPSEKRCACIACSEQHARDMAAADFDESVYNHGFV